MFIDIRNVIKAGGKNKWHKQFEPTNIRARKRHPQRETEKYNRNRKELQTIFLQEYKPDAEDIKELVCSYKYFLPFFAYVIPFISSALVIVLVCFASFCVCERAPEHWLRILLRMYPNYSSWKPGQIDLTLMSSTLLLLLLLILFVLSLSVHEISIKRQAA